MIYLDNAATSYPKPRAVQRRIQSYKSLDIGNPGRSGHRLSMNSSDILYNCRQELASLMGLENPENVVFTSNCTQSLNIAIKGVVSLFYSRIHVITTELEHNSVLRPLYKLRDAGKIRLSILPVHNKNDDEILGIIESEIVSSTKLLVTTHCSNVTGRILPIGRIGELAKRYNLIYIVDGAQSAGIIPINMKELNITMLCVPGHKGLFGPMGTGALLINQTNFELIETLLEGGTGGNSKSEYQPDFLPDRFEAGTLNVPGILGLLEGINFLKNKDLGNILRHEYELSQRFYNTFKDEDRVIFYCHDYSNKYSGVIVFNIEGLTSQEVGYILSNKDIAVRSGFHCAPLAHKAIGCYENGAVRVSPGIFNTVEDINQLSREVLNIIRRK